MPNEINETKNSYWKSYRLQIFKSSESIETHHSALFEIHSVFQQPSF